MLQNILKELRRQHNVTAKTVAEAVGILPDTYRSYETGRREPNLKTLVLIADYFKVTTDYLLGRERQVNPMDLLIAQSDLTPEVQEELYIALPPEAQALVLQVMRLMKENHRRRQAEKPPTIWIKRHQNKAAAGFGYDLSVGDEWHDVEVTDTPEAREADFAVEIDGDSMEPDYHDGDLALIKLDPDVEVGKVGLFIVGSMGYIKERGKKCLISHNPDYPNIEGEARCIGLVIGTAEKV